MPSEEADVVVIGGGGAGLAAALTAARLGRRVLVIEKNPAVGGTTARSVGSITATCTALQRAAGIEDEPAAHFEDMAAFAGDLAVRDNLDLRRLYVEEVPNAVRFLQELGVVFFGPMPEPPHRKPRMHNIIPHSGGYIHHLLRHCRRHGVAVRTDTRAERLLTGNGRPVGVAAATPRGEAQFRARRGVVVACGDYSASQEMKAGFMEDALASIEGINPASTGDGQRLALALGARVVNGDVMLGPEIRFVAPPHAKLVAKIPPHRLFAHLVRLAMRTLPDALLRPFLMSFVTTNLAPSHRLFEEGAILVNREGRRFCDERDRPQYRIPGEPGRESFIVFDERLAEKFTGWPHFISTAPGLAYAYLPDYLRNRRDIAFRAGSLEELAAKAGIAAAGLKESAKGDGDGPALSEPPFYALGPAKSWIVLTDGGLAVDTRLQVLDEGDKPIPGLYAAGSSGQGGLLLEGHGHHLGWAFVSGRIAGRNAAFEPGLSAT